MKGFKYRMAIRLGDLGVSLRWIWLIELSDRIKRSAMEEYI